MHCIALHRRSAAVYVRCLSKAVCLCTYFAGKYSRVRVHSVLMYVCVQFKTDKCSHIKCVVVVVGD